MEQLIKSSLASLANDIEFQVQKVSAADYYYTDGDAVNSFLKLVLHRKQSTVSIYLFENASYMTTSPLTHEERVVVDGWLEGLKSKKIEQDKIQMKLYNKVK